MNTAGDLQVLEISKAILKEVPARVAEKYSILPLENAGGVLRVAGPRELTREEKEEIRIVLGRKVAFDAYPRDQVATAVFRHYGLSAGMIETMTAVKAGQHAEAFEQDKAAQEVV